MKTLHLTAKLQHAVYVILVLLASLEVRAGSPLSLRPEIESVLRELDKEGITYLHDGSPRLGDQMRQLAEESQDANQLLTVYFGAGVSRPENFPVSAAELAKLWKWGGFAAAAFSACNGKFDEMLTRYPAIVLSSRLLGAMTKETGEQVLLAATLYGSRFDANHRYVAEFEIGTIRIIEVATGESAGGFETKAQDFRVVHEDGKDSLELITRSRGSSFTHTQAIVRQTYTITSNGTFELKGENTEVVPWPPAPEIAAPSSSAAVSPTSVNGNPRSQTATTDAAAPTPATVPKSPAAKPIPPSVETIKTTTSWAIVVVMIAAALGLLWLRLKRRTK